MSGRDPVDIAEMQRDYEETYGTDMQRAEDRYEYELNRADMEYGERDYDYDQNPKDTDQA